MGYYGTIGVKRKVLHMGQHLPNEVLCAPTLLQRDGFGPWREVGKAKLFELEMQVCLVEPGPICGVVGTFPQSC